MQHLHYALFQASDEMIWWVLKLSYYKRLGRSILFTHPALTRFLKFPYALSPGLILFPLFYAINVDHKRPTPEWRLPRVANRRMMCQKTRIRAQKTDTFSWPSWVNYVGVRAGNIFEGKMCQTILSHRRAWNWLQKSAAQSPREPCHSLLVRGCQIV